MAEITALSTLAKASVASTDYVVVANSSTKIAKRFQLQSLYPTVASPGTGSEDLYISATLTNQNQIQFKGLKSGDTGLLTVATASNNLVLTVLEAGIDLSLCNNATSVFLTGVDFTGSVTGTNAVVHGGTGLSTVAKGSLLYASATDTIAASAAMSTNGQLLIGNGSTGVPTVATLTAGANITITPAAGSITIAATLTTLAAALDTGSYNIDLNTNYISDNGSDRGLYVHTNGLVVCNNSGSTLTSGNITGQLNLQGTATTAVTIGNSGAYQSSYNILTTTSGSGTAGAALNIKAATAGGGNMAGGALSLYAGTATGSGAGGVVSLIAGDAASGTPGSALLKTYDAGGRLATALTADSTQDVTINEGSLIITGAQEGIVHTNSGTGTQATNHTTGITLNSTSGVITLAAVALAATTNAEFTVTNNTVQADSVILLTIQDENTTNNAQLAVATHTIAGGSFKISIVNPHSSGATSATASKIHFLVINNSV
jgi:hypothetical protein|tara:strand:+ start:2928 stop:4394 length:1467 start_codon:yes stop_codon:yes gene_type:complete